MFTLRPEVHMLWAWLYAIRQLVQVGGAKFTQQKIQLYGCRLRSRARGFDSRVGAQLRNDRGQVAHTRLPRR